MKLPCFDLNHGKRGIEKRLFKEAPKVTDLAGVGDIADWIDWKGREKKDIPAWMKEGGIEGLKPLRAKIDTKEKLRKARKAIDKRGEKKLNYRERLDVYVTKECQEWYSGSVKESLETLEMGDKLHDFIMAHPKYAVGQHLRWNSEFAKMIDIKPPEKYKGANKTVTDRRIAVAAQQVMVDHFNADVFKLVSLNGWDKEDGKVGPYTTRVFREYWTNVHSETSKKQPQPPTASDLGGGYKKHGPNVKKFAAAVVGLALLMATAEPDPVRRRRKTTPERQLGKRIRGREEHTIKKYADLDKAGAKLKTGHLRINRQQFDIDMSLEDALAQSFDETPKKRRPKTYRVLHLLTQKEGAKIKRMKIKAGDTLDINHTGLFNVKKTNGSTRYRVQLSNS